MKRIASLITLGFFLGLTLISSSYATIVVDQDKEFVPLGEPLPLLPTPKEETEETPAPTQLPENVAKLFEEVAVKLDMTCANMAMLNGLPYVKLVGITKTGTVFVATVLTVLQMGDGCTFEQPSQENILEIVWLAPDTTEPKIWLNEPLLKEVIKTIKENMQPDSEVPSKKINI